jgi:hypothetical protein
MISATGGVVRAGRVLGVGRVRRPRAVPQTRRRADPTEGPAAPDPRRSRRADSRPVARRESGWPGSAHEPARRRRDDCQRDNPKADRRCDREQRNPSDLRHVQKVPDRRSSLWIRARVTGPNRVTRTRGVVAVTVRGPSASVDTSVAVQLTYWIQVSGVAVPVTAIPLPGSAPMPTVRTPGRPRSAP